MNSEQQTKKQVAQQELDRILAGAADPQQVAAQLFELTDLLGQQSSLLRSLTDPARTAENRAGLIDDIMAGSCDQATRQIAGWLVSQHWAKPARLVAAMEQMGTLSVLVGARAQAQLAQVGTELFEVRRLFGEQRDLRIQLSDLSSGSLSQRVSLVETLFGGKILPATLQLLCRAVTISEHGHLIRLLRDYGQEVSQLSGSQLVTVTAAAPLTEPQRNRLQALLEKQVGRPVIMALALEPQLIGGFRIDYGDEAADSSIRTEISQARRVLAR